jgi:hypothetical protein
MDNSLLSNPVHGSSAGCIEPIPFPDSAESSNYPSSRGRAFLKDIHGYRSLSCLIAARTRYRIAGDMKEPRT